MSFDTHHDADIAPELAPLNLADKPDGPGAAMMISGGLGFFTLGLLTILSEMSEDFGTWLGKWAGDAGVGALAGKTTIASLVYFGSLALLWLLWRTKDVSLKIAFYVGLGLGILGAIATYPPFFTLFAP
ncbi:MAG TPA: hypothetical protein VES02_02525 [Dermatophilaceae bacterium]|nr:hypothetical protein [Dermatophilaceae bacterium]